MLDALEQMNLAGHWVESVLHVGANEGQERHDYEANGASPCLYVEPVDGAFATLKENLTGMPFHRAIQAVCAEREGQEALLNVAASKPTFLNMSLLCTIGGPPEIAFDSGLRQTAGGFEKARNGTRLRSAKCNWLVKQHV